MTLAVCAIVAAGCALAAYACGHIDGRTYQAKILREKDHETLEFLDALDRNVCPPARVHDVLPK